MFYNNNLSTNQVECQAGLNESIGGILIDGIKDKNGNMFERPWVKHKKNSLKLAESYARLGGWDEREYQKRRNKLKKEMHEWREECAIKEREHIEKKRLEELYEVFHENNPMFKRAEKVRKCADVLTFLKEKVTGIKRLKEAFFCKDRLCVMCSWRRSLRVFSDVSKVMDVLEKEKPDLVPLFITLTIKNPNGEKLQDTISQILSGWGLFMKQRRIERVVAGYWRTLEVTFKKSRDEYHPHIHAILMVDKSYFKGADYMDTKYWSEIWGRVIRVDYSPVCFVKRLSPSQARNEVSEVTKQQVVRSKSDREIEHNLSDIERVTSTEIARVAKYTYKNESVVKRSKVETDRIVSVLSTALKARRLCCFGGIMKEIAKRLKVKLEDGDLINIDEESIRPDVEMIILRYQWSVGIKNYVCVCCEEITQ